MTEWTLYYNVSGGESTQLRCRLHLESLNKDPHVESVTFEESATDPDVRILRVQFVEGESHPLRPDIRHLDKQFVFRVPTEIEEQEGRWDGKFVPYPKLSEYSDKSWRRSLPHWSAVGSWVVYTREQTVYQIKGVYQDPYGIAYLSLQEWRSFRCVDLPVEDLKNHYQPTRKPAEPLPWHQRLLLED